MKSSFWLVSTQRFDSFTTHERDMQCAVLLNVFKWHYVDVILQRKEWV